MNFQDFFFFMANCIVCIVSETLMTWILVRTSRAATRGVLLENFAKFSGKHLCQSLFFHKVAGLRPETLLKIRLWHMCFPVNFTKFSRTPFLHNTSGRLLLQ